MTVDLKLFTYHQSISNLIEAARQLAAAAAILEQAAAAAAVDATKSEADKIAVAGFNEVQRALDEAAKVPAVRNLLGWIGMTPDMTVPVD